MSPLRSVQSAARPVFTLRARAKTLQLGLRTAIMGVVNVTPDSFSDGARFLDPDRAVARALEMAGAGADIIDIGGESARPGADPIPAEEERGRVLPVLRSLRPRTDLLLSIDTTKREVAERALELGVDLVNDISGLTADGRLAEAVAKTGAAMVLMHMKGTPKTMQSNPTYRDVLSEVRDFLRQAVARAESAGVPPESILVDPGLGFGKTPEHNLLLLNRLESFNSLGKPVLIGPSRKTFIGTVLGLPVESRLHGTAATVAVAILRGAHVVRVHDVPEMAQVARMADAILSERASPGGWG